jgi:hypothetical protein
LNAPLPLTQLGDFYYRDSSGHVFKLGKAFGQGQFSRTYELAGKENAGLVIKFRFNSDPGQTPAQMVEEAMTASKELAEAGVPQMHVREVNLTNDPPYLISDILPKNVETFDPRELGDAKERQAMIKDKKWTRAHQQAVVDLFKKLIDHNLVAEDLHAGNLYFIKNSDGTYTAGILDHDRIMPFDKARHTVWFERALQSFQIRSFTQDENPEFKDAKTFMAKMLEHKRWIEFGLLDKQFVPKILDLDVVKDLLTSPSLDSPLPPNQLVPPKPHSWLPIQLNRRAA